MLSYLSCLISPLPCCCLSPPSAYRPVYPPGGLPSFLFVPVPSWSRSAHFHRSFAHCFTGCLCPPFVTQGTDAHRLVRPPLAQPSRRRRHSPPIWSRAPIFFRFLCVCFPLSAPSHPSSHASCFSFSFLYSSGFIFVLPLFFLLILRHSYHLLFTISFFPCFLFFFFFFNFFFLLFSFTFCLFFLSCVVFLSLPSLVLLSLLFSCFLIFFFLLFLLFYFRFPSFFGLIRRRLFLSLIFYCSLFFKRFHFFIFLFIFVLFFFLISLYFLTCVVFFITSFFRFFLSSFYTSFSSIPFSTLLPIFHFF